MNYKQYRADFAKTFFVEMTRRLPVYSNCKMPGTQKIWNAAKREEIRKAIATAAVRNADNLIAELERTEEVLAQDEKEGQI